MRSLPALFLLLCAGMVWAQTAEDPDVMRARLELERVKGLVQVGAMPRAQLVKAEEAIAEAQDQALLRGNLAPQELTEEKTQELEAAAARELQRRQKAFDEAKHLVESGLEPQVSLSPALDSLEFARRQSRLVETRARLAREIAQMAEAEASLADRLSHEPATILAAAERFDGDGVFSPRIFQQIESAYEDRFGKPLPVSANGETALHRALGFDHRGRVDVALRPDQPEGIWLRGYLKAHDIPFFAFRQAVPGKATGAHIHLGTLSPHLHAAE